MSTAPNTQPLSPQVQRPRKSQIGSIHRESTSNIHRENSPSPSSFRPRAAKTQSMPLMPSAMQVFASAQQTSPNGSNGTSRRSPQNPPQVQRLLPTPPHPSPHDERRSMSPSPPHPSGGVTHNPRPINRVPQQFLQKFQDGSDWQMTEELLADIERADQQQQVGQTYSHNYANGYQQQHNDMPAIQDPSQYSPNLHAPERPPSPTYHTPLSTPGEGAVPAPNYVQYREHHEVSAPALKRSVPVSLATQTPPLQAIHTRSPDRSLPVQEEPEEERESSPTPSSDLHPEGNSSRTSSLYDGRSSRAGHRDDEEEDTLIETSDKRSSEETQYTPRSPSSTLPDTSYAKRSRSSTTDQLGIRGLDPTFFEATPRKPPAPQQPSSQLMSDDFLSFMDNPTSAYIQAYLARSPRPDAPIPPTPHSQTNPPSPSPLISGGFELGGGLPPGSPYPYPFSHVRRVQPMPPPRSGVDLDPAVIEEQFAKQWQIFAQNNATGNVTESTLSPSGTPYPPSFDPWAYWHTQRILGNRMSQSMSMRSSPSHEPVALPPPRRLLKKKTNSVDLRRDTSLRKPPPRVESTQPRETSPEPSSSGEETAGETRFSAREEGRWVNGDVPSIPADEDASEWVDEEDEEDDLLELEFHPSYVTNVEKRRRRWEVGWDALVQAFQTLDRQTDATMVLMAAPSHSSGKLHVLRSRSVRRGPAAATLPLTAGFKQIAAQRKASRSQRFSMKSPTTDASGEPEDRIQRAMAVVASLNTMYETRWADEQRRWREDQMRVDLVLRQLLGEVSGSEKSLN